MMSGSQLPGVLNNLAPVLDHYGYLAVAAAIFCEDFGVPLPGETVLVAAAVYAGTGKLNVIYVGVVTFIAAVLGDNLGFAIGRFGGRRLVQRFGRYVLLTEQRLDKAEGFFDRHGGKVITVARFVEGLRQANGIVAGLVNVDWRRFLAFNALGAALWVGVWTCVGYFSGNHVDAIYRTVHQYGIYVGVAVGVVLIVVIGRALLRRRRRSTRPRHAMRGARPAARAGRSARGAAATDCHRGSRNRVASRLADVPRWNRSH